MTVRRGYREVGDKRWRYNLNHNDSFMSHQDEITPMPMQCTLHTHTAGHCKHPLWLLYDFWFIWQLWLQVSYRIHPDYHSMHKDIDNLPLDTQKYINAWSIGSLRWPCRIFWKLLSCAGRKAWGRAHSHNKHKGNKYFQTSGGQAYTYADIKKPSGTNPHTYKYRNATICFVIWRFIISNGWWLFSPFLLHCFDGKV